MEIIQLKLSVTNDYLIKVNDKFILIDTGYIEDWELFCKRLREAEVELINISHIILTHHHDDHCGLLNRIVQENNNIQIVMTNMTKELLLKGENDKTHGGGLLNKRISFLMNLKHLYLSLLLKKFIDKNNNLKFPPYSFRDNDIIVKDKIKLRDIGIDISGEFIETPGHTIDSISILFEDGSCFVGDAAANFLKFAGTKYCVVFIMDIVEYYNSWGKIIKEKAKVIYPAHGKSFGISKLEKNINKNKLENIVFI